MYIGIGAEPTIRNYVIPGNVASPEIRLDLQSDYELRRAKRDTGKEIESNVRRLKVAS